MSNEPRRPFLSMWVVYDHPSDFPNDFVARRWDIDHGGVENTSVVVTGRTLEDVRSLLPPGLYRLPRQPMDEPQILEVWL